MAVYKCGGRKFVYDGIPYCDYEAERRWLGPCPQCLRNFNCDKIGAEKKAIALALDPSTAKPKEYLTTGSEAFDEVIGGGLVKGSTVLLGGPAGIGKSSLLVAVACGIASASRPVIYASGEQTDDDIFDIARRMGVKSDFVQPMGNANDIYEIVDKAEELDAFLVIYDSLQVITCEDLKGDEGTSDQVKGVANVITAHHKREKTCGIIVNHVTKSGEFAGPETVQHLVETIVRLEPYFPPIDDDGNLPAWAKNVRVLETGKNRNGKQGALSYLEMTEDGVLQEVSTLTRKRIANLE